MENLNDIYNEYEGKKVGSGYNYNAYIFNLIKDINRVMASNNSSMIMFDYLDFCILDDGFYSINGFYFKPIFCEDKFLNLVDNNKYAYSNLCHDVTLKYLCDDLIAITSLVRNFYNRIFFHSYLYDYKTDLVYDYANNLIMYKKQYDSLIVYDELNVVNYYDVKDENFGDYSTLLYLALKKCIKCK